MSALTLIMLSVCAAVSTVNVGTAECGSIKLMNAVNNGPVVSKNDQVRDNFHAYKTVSLSPELTMPLSRALMGESILWTYLQSSLISPRM